MVAPDEMVGVPAHVLARLVWHALVEFDVSNPPPKLNAALHDALFALDLDGNCAPSELTRLMT